MVRVLEFATREEAEAACAEIDKALGYPAVGEGVCQAVRVGGGIHISHPHCCTLRATEVVEGAKSFAVPTNAKIRTADVDAVRELVLTKAIEAEVFENRPEPTPDEIKAVRDVKPADDVEVVRVR